MAFAVIRSGGQQYRVRPGDVIDVELIGDTSGPVAFDQVLLIDDDDGRVVGTPTVRDATVRGTVLAETKGRKLRIFTYQAKKRHRRHMGHRQRYTRVRIDGIERATTAPKATEKPAPKTRSKSPAKSSAKPKATITPTVITSKTTTKPKSAAKAKPKSAAKAKPKSAAKAKPKAKAPAKSKTKPKSGSTE